MNISLEEWAKYRDMLAKLSQKAADEFRDAVWNKSGAFGGVGLAKIPRDDLIRYAHALVTKYGEASSELACEMHDAIALASKAKVAAAIPAETADMAEVGKTINGVLKTIEDPEAVSAVVGKMVKQAGQDTTLQNALRDGAQFAWIPAGETCAFCLTLAANGWQYASKDAIKGGHAEHIHPNCDCAYAIRFDEKTEVEGYNPEEYKKMYYSAEGRTPKEKINSMRREFYAEARAEYGSKKKFKKISWVSFCEYDSDVGFAIKLNQDMKPYLLGLQNNYTEYTLDNILAMKSVYGIRIFELLQEKIKNGHRPLPKNGLNIELTVQYIRECCDCENKYERFSQFKLRVLDRAVEEINRVTTYKVSYDYVKNGKSVIALIFHINMKYH